MMMWRTTGESDPEELPVKCFAAVSPETKCTVNNVYLKPGFAVFVSLVFDKKLASAAL